MLAKSFLNLVNRRMSATFSTFAEKSLKPEVLDTDNVKSKVIKEINESSQKSRLFAIVYINGRQWKVGSGDLINLEGNLPLKVSDEINLEKVLMVGGSEFSVFGTPLLESSQVQVSATVVEKKNKSPELKYLHLNHHQTKKINWISEETTVLRINDIIVNNIE